METSLVFVNHVMPPLAFRRARETLSFVPLGSFRRTLKGDLNFIQAPPKFQLKIEGIDVEGPSFASLVRGVEVRVHPLHRLWERGPDLMRPQVPGSLSRVGELISYRPILEMRVLDLESTFEEWKNVTTWSLILEEI